MKVRFLLSLLAVGLLCGADMPMERPKDWAQPVISSTIGNFYKVSTDVFRAEQPESKDIPDLKTMQIKTLFSLREYHKDDAVFRQNDFSLIRYKMNAGSLSANDLVVVLKLFNKAEKPVLIHCWHGSDRTGFVVAGYRMIFQNWTKEAAIEELRLGGFGYHSRAYPNIVKTLQKMDVEAVRKSVLQEP